MTNDQQLDAIVRALGIEDSTVDPVEAIKSLQAREEASRNAVAHLLRRIGRDPRLAYYFDPMTESMELLTEAYTLAEELELTEFRAKFYSRLEFERPVAWED